MTLTAQLRQIEHSLQQNDRQHALRRLRQLIREHPNDPNVWWLMANATTDVSEVKRALDKTLELNPRHQLALQTRDALLREFPDAATSHADLAEFDALFDEHGIDMNSRLANQRPPEPEQPQRRSAWDWLQRATGSLGGGSNGGRNGGGNGSQHGTAALNPQHVSPTPDAPERDDRPLPLTGLLLGADFHDDEDDSAAEADDDFDIDAILAGDDGTDTDGRETLELDHNDLPWNHQQDDDDEFALFDEDVSGTPDVVTDFSLDIDTIDGDEFADDFSTAADDDNDMPAWLLADDTHPATDNSAAEDDFLITDANTAPPRPGTNTLAGTNIDVSWLTDADVDDMVDDDLDIDDIDAAPAADPEPDPPAAPPEVDDTPPDDDSSKRRDLAASTRQQVSREFGGKKRPVRPPTSEHTPPPPPTLPENAPVSSGPVIEEPPLGEQDSRGFSSRVAMLDDQTLDAAHQQLVAMVRVYDETAELCRAGTQFWVPLLFESVLSSGDYVRMDDTGSATLHIPGSRAVIDMFPRSAVQIAHLSHHNPGFDVELALVQGEILANFSQADTTHARYAICTPFAEFLLHGATLALRSEADGRILALNVTSHTEGATTHTALMQHAGVRYVLRPGQGVLIGADGQHSGILPATSFDQLVAAVDGVPFKLASQADVQLNVRRGPSLKTECVGTVDIRAVERVHAVSADKYWYRVRFGEHYRWVSGRDLGPVTDATILPTVPPDFVEHDEQIPDVSDEQTDLPTPLHRLELALLAEISEWRVQQERLPIQVRDSLQAIAERLLEASLLRGADAPEWAEQVTAYLGAATLRDDGFLDDVEGVRAVPGALLGKASSEIAILQQWKRLPAFQRLLGPHSDFYEVGIAATRLPDGGYTFVLVIGGVQAPTPVLLEPGTERVLIGPLAALLPFDALDFDAELSVQLVTREQKPSKKRWQRLQPWLPAPRTTDIFGVIFTDGKRTHRLTVDPTKDIAWLPFNPAIYRTVQEGVREAPPTVEE
jgi:hypothetical protein